MDRELVKLEPSPWRWGVNTPYCRIFLGNLLVKVDKELLLFDLRFSWRSSEISAKFYQNTWHHVPEESTLHEHFRLYRSRRFTAALQQPCGGDVEYLHRSPASRRRRQKGKSQIWESKIWSRVSRDSNPRLTALARARSNCKRQTRPLVRDSATVWQ
jgi:hypothetical protein